MSHALHISSLMATCLNMQKDVRSLIKVIMHQKHRAFGPLNLDEGTLALVHKDEQSL